MPELPGKAGQSNRSRHLVEGLEGAAVSIERLANLAQWDAWTTGKSVAYDKAEALAMKYKKVFVHRKDREEASQLLAAKDWNAKPFVRRRLQVLYKLLVEYGQPRRELEVLTELETRLDRLFSTFRPNLNGQPLSSGELSAILEHSTDRDQRRRAWSAQKAIGPLAAPLFLELMTRRNKMARGLGYPDFWHMQLELNELDADRLLAILDNVREHTDEPFRKVRTEIDRAVSTFLSIAPGDIRPWDMSDPFFQELPSCMRPNLGTMLDDVDPVEAVREWFSGIGFNVDTILENSSLYEAPGKNSHAFCVDLDRAGDVRILCNVRNTLHWHTTLLHELGHALYSAHVDRALPWSLRAEAHSLTTEGVAMFFEAMAVSEDYLAKVLGASSSQSAGLAAQLRRSRVLARLLFSRWCQVMVRFEKSAYENPEQDLDRTWWKLVQRYQLMECPQGGSGADWATKIHLSIAPVYYQNYLLGEIFAAQLRHTLSARPVTAGSNSLAPWMTDNIFAPGRRDPWPMLVETATGEPLEPGYLLAELLPGEAGRG